MRRCVMVMGMHRSGTSALTGILGLMGLDLGKTIMKPAEENPRGYFENQRVNDLNQSLLNALGSSWHDLFSLPNDWWKEEPAAAFSAQIRTLIEDEFAQSHLFGIKDPRICRLFPLWRDALGKMGIEIVSIIPVRHPIETARSLKLRHGFSIEKGLLLWMTHTLSSELLTRDIPSAWLSYEGLLRHTEKTIARTLRFLSLDLPKSYEDARSEISAFLDPALKHFDHRKDQAESYRPARIMGDWYRLLKSACSGDGADRKTIKAMDSVREEFDRLQALFHPIEVKRGEWKPVTVAAATTNSSPTSEAPAPAMLASESWQWLREYRDASQRIAPRPIVRERTRHFSSGPLTYHAHILRKDASQEAESSDGKPRIIHAIGNLRTGGSTRLVVDLYERLGHVYEQEAISADIPDPLHYDGFPFHDFSEPAAVEELAGYFREKSPHIIHIHHWLDPWYEKVMEAASQTGAMVIENVNTPFQMLKHPAVAHYVFVSRHARDSVSPVPENASVIYPGSDGALFSRSGPPADDTIGMVYRLDRDKLKEDSIHPLIEVVKRRPRTRVIIIGGGALLPSYRRQVAEAGVAGRFLFTGYVPYHDLSRWYAKFSVFAAPVWNESFGQVTPFAMAMGIPVAGYAVGALPEIMGADEIPDAGASLARTDKELTEILVKLLDDRDLRLRLGEDLRKRFDRLFRVETMIESYDELYRRLLASDSYSAPLRRAGSSL